MNENKDLSLKEDSSNFFSNLRSSAEGLEEKEVQKRKLEELKFALKGEDRLCIFKIFFNQFKSPLILLLLACALLAFFLSDPMDASIIFIIIFISSTLGMIQEKIAFDAMDRLMKLVEVKSKVIREGIKKEISSKEVVTGDLLLLEAGDVLPADAIIIESEHFFVNQAALTGESLPAEKISFNKELDLSSKKRENCVLMGSYVISGAAKAIVFAVGSNSELGKISKRLKAPKLETNFEKGMRKFQGLLVETTFALVFLIFAVNVFLKRGVIDSFLFSLALGIGLTPQLLPMIISVTLAKGARDLAKKKVIIKKSSSLENFGSMSVLCCDKTGTLTSGEMSLHSFYDLDRRLSPHALEYAAVTSFLHAGYDNPLDQAIKKKIGALKGSWEKLDEIPFDFERRRVTLLAKKQSKSQLIVKGSFSEVVKRCSFAQNCDGVKTSIDSCIDQLELLLEEFSEKNSKILAVAYKDLGNQTSFSDEDEMDLIFLGLLEFYDPLKPNVANDIAALKDLGVELKIISGDNEHIVRQISVELNLNHSQVVKGFDLEHLEDLALISLVKEKSLFAEITPLDKLRIVQALQQGGKVVGFLGDGLNDSAAMRQADVSISVQNATNVAREAADFILLESSLKVLADGVEVGRKIFANTLKYIFIATSANFGNMFSMALSSLFLPFLPLLPKQVLLTNLFTDLPEFTISTDKVDAKWKNSPQNWDLSFIKRFMIVFGLISSIFDLTTFVILKSITTSVEAFRTGWFIESVMSASLVLLVIRTERPSYRSRPSTYLFVSVIAVNLLTLITPLTPLGKVFGLVPLEPRVFFAIFIVIFAYMLTAEIAKKFFYKNQ